LRISRRSRRGSTAHRLPVDLVRDVEQPRRRLGSCHVPARPSACGGADDDGEQGTSTSDASTSAPSPSLTSTSGEQDAGASAGTPIRISFGDTELTARLHDNATARDLAAQLPLTLTLRDHNNVEKTAPLPASLSLDDALE
jgi:hypothetical protein